jgi:tetratricopeptide (TPR) repeat protein
MTASHDPWLRFAAKVQHVLYPSMFWLSTAIFFGLLGSGLIHRFTQSGPISHIGLNHLADADSSYDRGDYVKAVEQYTRSVEIAPGDYQAWLRLGVAAQQVGQEDVAVSAFHSVIKINRQHAGAHYLLGLHYLEHNNLVKAVQHNQMAVRSNPGFAEAYNNLATALLRAGKRDSAITYYRKALALNPNLTAARASLESLGEALDFK